MGRTEGRSGVGVAATVGARAKANGFAVGFNGGDLLRRGRRLASSFALARWRPHAPGLQPNRLVSRNLSPNLSRNLSRALLVLGVLAARPASAQVLRRDVVGDAPPSASAAAAYAALALTPVGAFAPSGDYLLTRTGAAPSPMRLHGRFGTMDRGFGSGQRAWGATLDVPVGVAALSITGGYVDATCDHEVDDPASQTRIRCGGGLTLGARLGSVLVSRSLDAAGTTALVVGTELTTEWANVDLVEGTASGSSIDATVKALTGTIAIPVAIPLRSGGVTVAPMVAPRFGYARSDRSMQSFGSTERETLAGGRFMLGAGVAVRFGDRVGFDAGLQKILIDDGDTTYGMGLSIGF